MIKLSRLNVFMFLLMFLIFVFTSKITLLLGIRIVGIEYYAWMAFALILAIINFGNGSAKVVVKDTYLLMSGLLVSFCIVNYFFVDVPMLRYAQGTFFTFLFILNFVLFYNLTFEFEDFYRIGKAIVLIVTAIGFLTYVERFLFVGNYQPYVLRGVVTVAKDPSFVAALLNINIILCLALFVVRRRRLYIYIVVFSIITISLLLFIKALFSALIICFVFVRLYYNSRLTKLFVYAVAAFFFIALIFIAKPLHREIDLKLNMYFGEGYENIPRNALYLASFKIAYDYFPFGSGQGTFGSYPVGKVYSQIYYDYKLDNVQGLSEADALGTTSSQFVFDTHWSSIIGEVGFIATMVYLWLWLFPAINSLRFLWRGSREVRAIAFVVCMMTVSIFIESIAAPLPGQLQFIMLYAGLGALGCRLLNSNLIYQRD